MQILLSTDFGGAWSAQGWKLTREQRRAIATYAPIIMFLEVGGNRNDLHTEDDGPRHFLVQRMIDDLNLKDIRFSTYGASGLRVVEIDTDTKWRIESHDGKERLITEERKPKWW